MGNCHTQWPGARLTCGLKVEPDSTLDIDCRGDALIVIASFNQQQHAGPAHLKLIKRLARNFSAIGGIEAGELDSGAMWATRSSISDYSS